MSRRYAVWNRWTWKHIGPRAGKPISTFDSPLSAAARAGMEMQRFNATYLVVDRHEDRVIATVETSGAVRLG